MVNGMPDSGQFFEVVGGLIRAAAKAGKREHSRVAACGEIGPFLWGEGKADAAIRLEQITEQLAKTYEVDIFCAYPLSSFLRARKANKFSEASVPSTQPFIASEAAENKSSPSNHDECFRN